MVTMTRGSTWKIPVYGAEHGIPHFHIETRRSRCTVGIGSLEVIIGEVAARDLREAQAWAREHQSRAAGAMACLEQVNIMESLRTLKSVKPLSNAMLRVHWSNGIAVDLDLSDLLKSKAYKSLRGRAFQGARVDEWGHSVEWPNGAAMGADALWRRTLLARGHADTVAFLDWRLSHGLSLSDAADALGLSRRMVAYYSSGAKPVPKTVLLACRGWEHTRDAA